MFLALSVDVAIDNGVDGGPTLVVCTMLALPQTLPLALPFGALHKAAAASAEVALLLVADRSVQVWPRSAKAPTLAPKL